MSRAKKKLTEAEKLARKIVGDGKLPNKYFVVVSNHWLIVKKRGKYTFTVGSDELFEGKYKGESETFGPYDTYKEAWDKLNEEMIGFVPPTENGYCSGYIDDRISGEIASCECVQFTKKFRNDIFKIKIPLFEFETRQDYQFTKDEMEKRGKVFV